MTKRKPRQEPPEIEQGWIRVFAAMGDDMPPNEWAMRYGLSDHEVQKAFNYIKNARRCGLAVY